MANFGFDFDGTLTEDPELFKLFVFMLRKRGHQVHIVTMRYASEGQDIVKEWGSLVDGIHFTRRQAKRPHMEELGIKIHIWLEDTPRAVEERGLSIWGWESAEGEVIIEDHGTPKLPPVTKEDVLSYFLKPIKVKSNHYADLKAASLRSDHYAEILKKIELSPGIEVVPNDYPGFTVDLTVYFLYPESFEINTGEKV